MFDVFKHTVDILTSSTERWTTKTATVALIFFGLWYLNNTFDFTHSFRLNNKLQQLEQLGQLIKDSTLTKEQTDILIKERELVFERMTTLDNVYSFLLDSLPNTNFIKSKTDNKPKPSDADSKTSLKKDDNVDGSIPTKNYWWTFVSGNFILLFVMLFVPFNTSFKKGIIVMTVANMFVLGVLFLVCMFFTYILDLIPVIAGRPWINYILNFVIQFVGWMTFGLILSKIPTKKKE
jgi:hypothetical protein